MQKTQPLNLYQFLGAEIFIIESGFYNYLTINIV